MEKLPNIMLRRGRESWGRVTYEFTQVHFSPSQAQPLWVPAINAYRLHNEFLICVELAGVDRARVHVQVETRRLWIHGQRRLPEPESNAGPPLQVLALEIDHGPFTREVMLPVEVLPDSVLAEQRNGLLWIRLPLRSPARGKERGKAL